MAVNNWLLPLKTALSSLVYVFVPSIALYLLVMIIDASYTSNLIAVYLVAAIISGLFLSILWLILLIVAPRNIKSKLELRFDYFVVVQTIFFPFFLGIIDAVFYAVFGLLLPGRRLPSIVIIGATSVAIYLVVFQLILKRVRKNKPRAF